MLLLACGHSTPATQQPDAGQPDAGPAACPAPPPRPAVLGTGSATSGSAPGKVLLRGRIVTPDSVFAPGEVLIQNDRISCVGASCAGADGATILDTQGVIFPGLVDAHNHTQYDYLPPWKPPHLYQNRYQWASEPSYKAAVQSLNANETAHVCEQVKYGEVRALTGGTTTIQGTFNSNRKCFRTLVHNAEYGNELAPAGDKMATNIPGVSSIDATAAASLRQQMLDGSLTAYVIHLAEGVDESSRAEFDQLEAKGLLLPPVVLIHGTALGQPELHRMGLAGAKLVWSPLSNLGLYGATTNVPLARAENVAVALAPDWTLSGSPSMLDELRVARHTSCEQWNNALSAKDLTQMVTSIPAQLLALDGQIGRLAPGLLADVLVVADRGEDPYETLLGATLADVRLVMIGGVIRYGDPQLMAVSGRTQCESVTMCGAQKTLCVPDNTDGTDTLNQSFADISAVVSGFFPSPYPLSTCN